MTERSNFEKIRKRIPLGTLGIEYYDISSIIKKTGEFEDVVDQRISRLKGQGVEIGNYSEYFEDLIEEYITRLLGILEIKHLNNMNVIKNLFRKRASDKIELGGFLNNLEEEIAITIEEYNTLKNIYEKANPLEKMLQNKPVSPAKKEEEEENEEEEEEDE